MDRQGEKWFEIAGANDKWQITAVFCGTMLGDFYQCSSYTKESHHAVILDSLFPSDWHITYSPNHWSTEKMMQGYVEHIIVPYIKNVRENVGNDKAALVIMDNFKGQVTESV